MEGSDEPDSVQPKPSSDVIRKKLEAELRATEEIARIRQSVIEKRLAVELATLGEEPPGMIRVDQLQQEQQLKSLPRPVYPTLPKMAIVDQRRTRTRALRRPVNLPESDVFLREATSFAFAGVRLQKSPFSLRFRRSPGSRSSIRIPTFLMFSQKHEIPDIFISIRSDSRCEAQDEEEEEDEEEVEGENRQPRSRGSFFKGVMKKFKRRLLSEDREQE